MRDEDVRASCFAQLSILCAEFGEDVPYLGGLDRKFAFRGQRIPYLNRQKGIYRAAAQRGPAALSIQTSYKSPYGDTVTDEGVVYAYRAGSPEQSDNRALRAAFELQVPLVHFVGTRPGWYRPNFPCYVTADDASGRVVMVTPGRMVGPLDDPEAARVEDPIERRYLVRETRVRMHQAQFRGRILPAYLDRCAICQLKEARLLDAAHIVGDLEQTGEAVVSNGMSLCSIHHRTFDQYLLGISPDYKVEISRRLLDDEDGPMLDLLKGHRGREIQVPERKAWKPDRERLAVRFERFLECAA